MALSPDLISQFAKLTNNENKKISETTVRGTFKTIDGEEFVQIDGSDIWTPVTSTVEAETGERVTVLIKDHTATVTGNITSPTARTKTVENLKDEVDEHGNTIKQLDNTITQQGNSIIQINNNIKQQGDTINSFGNTIDSQNNKIQAFDNTIKQQGDNITSMNNTITQQGNQISSINNTIEQHSNTINQHDNLISQQGNTITQQGNTISQQGNLISQQGNTISQQNTKLETLNSDVTILNSGFKIEDGVLTGLSEIIVDDLETNNLDAKYANIDFSNIKEAAIEKLFSDSGIIKDLIMSEGKVTGELVGVTIKGDLIEGNTVKADKLVILGEDGLYYKLNVDALGETTASSDEKYQNGLDGSVIVAESITAEKIAVDDLVAFGATIGGYHITDHALYSGVKNSATNTTRGVYLGDDGQIAFGDANNYLRFIEDNGVYKLEISANSIKFGTSGTTVEDAIKDVSDNSITSSVEEFYLSNSPTSLDGGEWSTTQAIWTEGKYIWRRTLVTKGDGSTSYQPSENGVCITGNTGPAGADGKDGTDGNGIVSVKISYQYHYSGTSTPTDEWSDEIPYYSGDDYKYLWTKTETTYISGEPTIAYSVSRMADDGLGIMYTENYYIRSENGENPPSEDDEWLEYIPKPTLDKPYLWTRVLTVYTDESCTNSYVVSFANADTDGVNLVLNSNIEYNTSDNIINEYTTTSPLFNGTTYTASICVDPDDTLADTSSAIELSLVSYDENKFCQLTTNEYGEHVITKTFTVANNNITDTDSNLLKLTQDTTIKDYMNFPEEGVELYKYVEYIHNVNIPAGTYRLVYSEYNDITSNYIPSWTNIPRYSMVFYFMDNELSLEVESEYLSTPGASGTIVTLASNETRFKLRSHTLPSDSIVNVKSVRLEPITNNTNYLDVMGDQITLSSDRESLYSWAVIPSGSYKFECECIAPETEKGYIEFDDNNIKIPYNEYTDKIECYIHLTTDETNMRFYREKNNTTDNAIFKNFKLTRVADDKTEYFFKAKQIVIPKRSSRYRSSSCAIVANLLSAGTYRVSWDSIDITEYSDTVYNSMNIEIEGMNTGGADSDNIYINKEYMFNGYSVEVELTQTGLIDMYVRNGWSDEPVTINNLKIEKVQDINYFSSFPETIELDDDNPEFIGNVDIPPGIYRISYSESESTCQYRSNDEIDIYNSYYGDQIFIDNDMYGILGYYGNWLYVGQHESEFKITMNDTGENTIKRTVIKDLKLQLINDLSSPDFIIDTAALTPETFIPVNLSPGTYIALYDDVSSEEEYDYYNIYTENNDQYMDEYDFPPLFHFNRPETSIKIYGYNYGDDNPINGPITITNFRLYKINDNHVNYFDMVSQDCELEYDEGSYYNGSDYEKYIYNAILPSGSYRITCSGIDMPSDTKGFICFSRNSLYFEFDESNANGFTGYLNLLQYDTGIIICASSDINNENVVFHDLTLTRVNTINRLPVLNTITIPASTLLEDGSSQPGIYRLEALVRDYSTDDNSTEVITYSVTWNNISVTNDGDCSICIIGEEEEYPYNEKIDDEILIDQEMINEHACSMVFVERDILVVELRNYSNEPITITGLKIRGANDIYDEYAVYNENAYTNCIKWIKVEKGEIATDWSPAPEDVINVKVDQTYEDMNELEENLTNRINEAQATIEVLQGLIANLVTDENGGSLMTQTPDGWTFNMGNVTSNLEAIRDAMVETNNKQQDANDELQKMKDLVDDVVAKTAYIEMKMDDNGDPYIELGRSDNLFKVRITNTAIDFLEGSTKIAYANNNTFYSSKLITKAMQIGEGPGFIWQTRASGNMGLIYISE